MVNIATLIFVVDFRNGVRNSLYIDIHQESIGIICDNGLAQIIVRGQWTCDIMFHISLHEQGDKIVQHTFA